MKGFDEWKIEKIKSIKADIEYHKNKLERLKLELKVYEVK